MSLNRDCRIARPLTAGLFVLLLLTAGTPPVLGQDEKADTKAALSEQQKKLNEADRLDARVVQLYEAGKAREAVAPARQALAIRKQVLGERHPYYGTSLSNLALKLSAQHDFGGAAPRLEQALEIGERNLDLTASVQAERQQMAMAAALRPGLGAYLTIGPLAKVPAGHAYRHVLTRKGAILERQRHLGLFRRLGRANPDSENARLFVRLEQTSARLATLALGTPDLKQADAWRAQVAELTREKEEIETKLAGKDATFRAAQAEARRQPEEVQASLPSGTALIDFLERTCRRRRHCARHSFLCCESASTEDSAARRPPLGPRPTHAAVFLGGVRAQHRPVVRSKPRPAGLPTPADGGYPLRDEDETFVREIEAHPTDRSIRRAYADWLDQAGDQRGADPHRRRNAGVAVLFRPPLGAEATPQPAARTD